MENYVKLKSEEHELVNPFSELIDVDEYEVAEVKVSARSIAKRVVGFAMSKLKKSSIDAVMLVGYGRAVNMVRKCTRALNKQLPDLHQCDAEGSKVFEDFWACKEETEVELDMLSVKQHVPALFILLAKNQLPQRLQSHPHRLRLAAA